MKGGQEHEGLKILERFLFGCIRDNICCVYSRPDRGVFSEDWFQRNNTAW